MQLSFSVEAIREKITENRTEHKATYDEALSNFKDELVEAAGRINLAAVQYNNGEIGWDEYSEIAQTALRLRRPTHYLDHYDSALSMLELTVAATVTLSVDDYARYVLDDWEWKDSFVGSTSTYLGGKFR